MEPARAIAPPGTRRPLGIDDLGIDFGHGLSQREVDYLVQSEWAVTAEDILWRRTKLGLVFDDSQVVELNRYLNEKLT